MIFGAILAGGTGSRMKLGDTPKQFLPLGDKPIVIHTLEKFLLYKKMDKIYIGVHPVWLTYMEDLIKKHITNRQEEVICVSGGEDRNGTIMNIISAIESAYGSSEEHFIVTHDSVRPFVTLRIIEDNIKMVEKCGACDTVIPAVDTIVCSKDGKYIQDIPERIMMYQGQTPQSFQITKLKKLYSQLTDDEKRSLTDACKICVLRGMPVELIRGEVSNMKITTVTDYKIAQAMMHGEAM